MKHQTMNDSQNTIHTIYHKQNNPTKIPCLDDQLTDKKQDDKCNTDRPYITGKTLRTLSEIKEIENQYK